MKRCLLQYADGREYVKMMHLTAKSNEDYCRKYGADYWPMRKLLRADKRGGWQKVAYIIDYLRNYDQIIYMDVDCILRDLNYNLFDECTNGIGLTQHLTNPGVNNELHYNTGVLFINNSPEVKELLTLWDRQPENDHAWVEQLPFQQLAIDHLRLIHTVDNKFNATANCCSSDDPVIRGFHGMPDRYNLMKEYLEYLK